MPIIIIMYIHDWHHSSISGIPYIQLTRLQCTTIHGAFPLLLSPLASFSLFPFVSLYAPFLLTWNPPSCDRICPPWSQVVCKLTLPVPPLTQPSPFQIPRTPTDQRLTETTSGIIRRLLSGTLTLSVPLGAQSGHRRDRELCFFCFFDRS